jgi:N-methylhydantoinase B
VCSTSLSCRHPDTGEDALLVEPHAGGWGASESSDGQNGVVSVGDGETYIIPVEVAEQRYGIRVERFALNIQPDAGAGRQRGGYGLIREYRILSDEAIFTVAMGRHDALPWGVDGGEGGSPNYVEIHYASGDVSDRFGKGTALPLVRGDLIRIVTGTGGGWGPPGDRDEALMRRDQQNGYI